MIPEQQRYWIALLNLQRGWQGDRSALAFLPPRHRDFTSSADWTQAKALAYLLNNLELLRESYDLIERGKALDYDLINHVLEGLTVRLQGWPNVAELQQATRTKTEVGGRLEVLRAQGDLTGSNPGTRYIRATVQRSFYYFAHYVDDRLSDPAYPGVSPDRWHVRLDGNHSGDLVLVPPRRGS